MNTITINGKTISVDGGSFDSVSVINGNVFVNGNKVNTDEFASAPVINIVVEGPVTSVSNQSGDVTVKGDAGSVKSTSGNVEVEGGVKGSVNTVSGDVRAGGSIGGSVNTVSGDIRSKR